MSHPRKCTLYPQKLAPSSPTSGGRSVGIVRSRTQATEFSLVLVLFPVPTSLGGGAVRTWNSSSINLARNQSGPIEFVHYVLPA
jgi:hypothetical protein